MPIKSDAQSIRSKEWMLNALITLMKEKNFDDITVSEITKHSDLDRRTFYRHFKTKEDIIRYKIQKMSEEYETILLKDNNFTTQSIAISFFTICEKNKELLMLFYKHKQLPLFLYELNVLFHKFHNKYTAVDELLNPNFTDYALSYHIGGFWNTLNIWLSEGAYKSPEEIAVTIKHILPEYI